MKRLSKLGMLYSAIHQMTKAEKRLFRMEINKLKRDTAYSKLFDYLLTLDTYDEERIKSYFHTREIPNFNVLVNHLFDKLISFLATHRPLSRRSPLKQKVRQMMDEAEMTFQLGFPARGHKMMKKALKTIIENNLYDLVDVCFVVLFIIEHTHPELQLSHADIVGTSPVEVNVRKFSNLRVLNTELYILMIKAESLYSDAGATEEDWKIIIENTTLKNINWKQLNFRHKVKILRINIRYNNWLLEFEKSIQQSKELLLVNEESEEMIFYFQGFMMDYDFHCQVLYKTKHQDLEKAALKFSQLTDKYEEALKAIMPQAKLDETLAIHQAANIVIQQYNLLSASLFTIRDAHQWSNKIGTSTPWGGYYRRQSLMLSAFMYLLLKAYDRFQDYRNMILDYKEETDKDAIMRWEIEILDLIEIYENNTKIYFSNYLRSSIRKNKQKAASHETIIYMFQLFNKLRKTSSQKAVLEAALPEITALETKSRFHTLHFSTWVRWRCK